VKAVILAGGEGSRLGGLTRAVPKSMVRVGPYPILEHQIRLLKRYGFTDILLLVGRLHEQVVEYFGDGKKFDVSLAYHVENRPLGTTGGIKENEHLLHDDFVLFYGDVILDINICKLVEFHRSRGATATLVLHPNDHPFDSDLTEIAPDGRITAFHPKPHRSGWCYRNLVSAAVYVLSPRIHRHIEKGRKRDFGRDIFPQLTQEEPVYGYVSAEYIKDVGTPERLAEVTADYESGKVARLNLDNRRRAVFLDRDGVINRHVGLLHRIEDFELSPGVIEAIRGLNSSEYLAVVVTNQPVVARGLCSMAEVEAIHKKMETLLGEGRAKLDAVYFCPHHPDRGYPEENPAYKVVCNCRKPATGMLETAAEQFNIDLAGSYIVGDSSRDIQCGRNAGVTSYAVRCGEDYGDESIRPDGTFEDLAEAVGFILAEPFAAHFDTIEKHVSGSDGRHPAVIAIGGNTRSGKSLLAGYLARRFRQAGRKVLYISLDDWLVPAAERTSEMGVHQRYRVAVIAEQLTRLLKQGEQISAPGYAPQARCGLATGRAYSLSDEEIVILDGVVALATRELRGLADCRVFMRIDEELLASRVTRYYQWKELANDDLLSLLEKRGSDEYGLVAGDEQYADLIIDTLV